MKVTINNPSEPKKLRAVIARDGKGLFIPALRGDVVYISPIGTAMPCGEWATLENVLTQEGRLSAKATA